MKNLELTEFLKVPGVVLDVRSPCEYTQGRIPGSLSLPLFTDQERSEVGTAYKQSGRDIAVELGLSFAGPKLLDLVHQAKEHLGREGPDCLAKILCWRGGMRSSSVAWLLETAGVPVLTLKGGYRAFRRWVLSTLDKSFHFIVLGGLTGSGKTDILKEMSALGYQILDLEKLANHKGSSYGMLEMPDQPSTEQFENLIAYTLSAFDPLQSIWVEDESRLIGRCKIPDGIFRQIRSAPVYYLESPLHERVKKLKKEYGHLDRNLLINATMRLTKRLGGSRTQKIVQYIQQDEMERAIELSLQYYDKAYLHGISMRSAPIYQLPCPSEELLTSRQWAQILKGIDENHNKKR